MKVLYLLTDFFHPGGAQTDIIELTGLLAPEGVETHVAAPWGNRVEILARAGAHFHAMADPTNGHAGMLRYLLGAAKAARKIRPDILAPQSVRTTFLAYWIRRLAGLDCPIVTTIHNLHDPSSAPRAASVLSRYADALCFENEYERNMVGLTDLSGGGPVKLIRSGIDLEKFSPLPWERLGDWSDEPVLGCVARLNPEKNHSELLNAWALHKRSGGVGRLVLVGDGPERDDVEALIATLVIGDSVELAGDRGDVPELLPRFDLFALSSSRESYPLSGREAMAAGVPVVLPDIGGCGEVVGDEGGGRLYSAGDIHHLADVIGEMLPRTKEAEERRLQARARACRHFDRQRWGGQLLAFYRGAIESRHPTCDAPFRASRQSSQSDSYYCN
ncbi:MAG: glycosyltransferase [bacterium]|nr:glycosyltransferase [bacterium]